MASFSGKAVVLRLISVSISEEETDLVGGTAAALVIMHKVGFNNFHLLMNSALMAKLQLPAVGGCMPVHPVEQVVS